MKKKVLLFLAIFGGLSIYAQPASAISSEDVIMLFSPVSQTISMDAGQEKTGKITITNAGEVAFDFVASVAPFQVSNETYDLDLHTNNVYTQLYSWITIPQAEYHLEPQEAVNVEFNISVPEGAPAGGQYAAIIATVKDVYNEGATVQVTPQVAALLYGRVNGPDMNPQGEIAEQTIPNFLLDGPLNISETVYNTGNVDFKVYHSVTIEDFFSGQELLNKESKDSAGNTIASQTAVLLPGTSYRQTITWENTPQIGVVRVKQTVKYLEDEFNYEQVVVFCPLWLICSVVGLIALAILWIILSARHRKRKAPQVF